MKTILFQKNSNDKFKFIEFELEGKILKRTWGLVEGKIQTTSHTYQGVNLGKSNELSPEEVALGGYLRIIKKKKREGYLITQLSHISSVDWSEISTSFCCSKPISKPNEKKINQAIKNENCIIQKKYNGLCHYVLITDENKVKIYTRRMNDHTRKYPKIVRLFKEKNLPPKTILITEFIIDPYTKDHLRSFKIMSSISKVNTLKGDLKEDQTESYKKQEKDPVYCIVFGILYYEGEPIWKAWNYSKQWKILKQRFDDFNWRIRIPEVFFFRGIRDMNIFLRTKKKSLEGLVSWILDEKLEVTMNGKPKRRAAYKVKVNGEDDFIAYGWNEGNGRKQGKIGALKIGKMKDGEIFPIGVVGSGLKDDDLYPETWDFPCVVVIEYANIFKTGKLQHPVFICKHGDKVPEEVIL